MNLVTGFQHLIERDMIFLIGKIASMKAKSEKSLTDLKKHEGKTKGSDG